MNLSFLISLGVLLIVIDGQTSAEPDLLVPNYDNLDHKLKAFQIRKPLVLHCNITKETEHHLSWEKDGVEVDDIDLLKDRYTIIDAENKFIIPRTEETDAGLYSCHLGDNKKEFHVLAELAVNTPDDLRASESEEFEIPCEVVGSAPRIHWQIGNITVQNSTDKYILKANANGIKNALLRVENVTLDDRGDYVCVGTNLVTDLEIVSPVNATTFVRVKSHLASVWPGLGILAEVVILGVITIFARKHDAKLEVE